ncbi:MAG: TIGR00296 family protein [Thermoprotei archaeon]|nr:MAG: TIGR00296 family protein [Thermoprotei archaeon]
MKLFKPYNIEEGKFLVELARNAIREHLRKGITIEAKSPYERLHKDRYGVFVTLETLTPSGTRALRGCIGFPFGHKSVAEDVVLAAIESATGDPRFPPLTLSELSDVVIEVSVLSPMELIKVEKPKDYLNEIIVGIHGLYVSWGVFSGLLLPQVPVDYGWDTMTFISEACIKAGLHPDAWLEPGIKIYRFQAQVFQEQKPEGPVVERDLLKEAISKGLVKREHVDKILKDR